ncbi:MAG: nucleoside triphosphate pyrophosphatase [Pseudomonadota bacterium]
MNSPASERLILASTSPYRKRLLERLQISFETAAPDVDETPMAGESPKSRAVRLSREKALAVSAGREDALTIGSDQVASIDDQLLHKPGNQKNAIAQLTRCSGREVQFHTGVALVQNSRVIAYDSAFTSVQFRRLSEPTISDYVIRDQPFDCAGSFRWEGLGIALFERLTSDDPTALEGLPLITLVSLLAEAEISNFI